ncbi:MAG: carbamoyltransferase [Cyclobacteriaceae bacterium]|nr:MAG: carbamoyltransferase [Cyclobacteriaceae bacterium]
MTKAILGVSAYYHDSAAAIIVGGEIIAAAHEERFTRIKHDASFPIHAVRYVLEEAGIDYESLDAIAFYDKPLIKFERLLETYHAFAPKGLPSFISAIPVWIKEKLFMKKMLRDELGKLGNSKIPIFFPEHHLSHAASAFYPSPYEEAVILTIDGVGEWATCTICHGQGNQIKILKELSFPHSVGLLYSAFTYYCGFKVNSGEYKLMGLAPYGNHQSKQTQVFKEIILKELVDIRDDGSILLNMNYFGFATGLRMAYDRKWLQIFGIPRRKPESKLSQDYMNLALAIQQVTEEIVIKLAQTAKKITGCKNLVLAGGVALNCVANGKLLTQNIFEGIWIQPAAGDAGGSLGAAYTVWYIDQKNERTVSHQRDSMKGSYLGPEFSDKDIIKLARKYNAKYKLFDNFQELATTCASILAKGNVVGWFQDRMEYGPRALGNRSILGDARDPEMQKKMNLKIKYREGFRPFAPSVLEEDIEEYFKLKIPSPYMLLVVPVQESRCHIAPEGYQSMSMSDRLYYLRSDIPAITHIDYSARVQSVNKDTNPKYWQLINAFKEQTGYGLVVNTSFNVRGEPIVCTPEDGYRCFMRTEMDYLVMGNFLFTKSDQPEWQNIDNWQEEFELD